MNIGVRGQLRSLERHKTTLLFVGKVVGHIQLYGELKRGGGGVRSKMKNNDIKTFGASIIRGRRLLLGPPPDDFQVLPLGQLGSKIPGAGAPGRAELGAASQALDGSRRRRVISEGSLPLMGRAPRHRAETEGRKGKDRAQARGTRHEEAGAYRLEGNQERIMDTQLEGDRGVALRRIVWGRVM